MPDDDHDQLWIGYVRTSYEVEMGSCGWASVAAHSLEHNGFCVLRSGGIAPDLYLCEQCASVALCTLDQLLQAVVARGIDPLDGVFNFKEVCKRHGGARYDMALAFGGEPWAALHAFVDSAVQRVVAETSALRGASVDRAGCVVSFPGTPAQELHTDGAAAGFFNAFVPLTPVGASNGTELLPGTHRRCVA